MSTGFPESVNKWLKNSQYWLLPPTCILCRQPAGVLRDLCASCEILLPQVANPCRRCALPLPPGHQGMQFCGTCMVLPPPYTRLVAPFDYRPPLPALVAAFKYRRCLVNGRELASCLIDTLQQQYASQPQPAMLVPVPLHNRRLRQRGYNQSLELARWLSRQMTIPVRHDIVARVRHTPQQAGLSAAARKKNLRGAFQVNRNADFTPDAPVAIVDDVVTTGTTVSALAKTLLKAGAPEVHVWAIARTCP